jgi:hypothetical protein
MIGDNLSSHMSLEVLDKCQEERISFVFLPPLTSIHLTQLAIGYSLVTIYWRQVTDEWKQQQAMNVHPFQKKF